MLSGNTATSTFSQFNKTLVVITHGSERRLSFNDVVNERWHENDGLNQLNPSFLQRELILKTKFGV